MSRRYLWGSAIAGAAAGTVVGFFGAGGGMVLIPMLGRLTDIPEASLFSASLRIMLPICLTALIVTGQALPWREALPYLLGSILGGLLALRLRIPTRWLHRILGLLILLGGVRMLWT